MKQKSLTFPDFGILWLIPSLFRQVLWLSVAHLNFPGFPGFPGQWLLTTNIKEKSLIRTKQHDCELAHRYETEVVIWRSLH